MMNSAEFEANLAQEGYTEVVKRGMEADKIVDEHDHPFDAKLLILEGELTLTREGATRTYHAGDIFSMAAGCRHVEQSGSEGALYRIEQTYGLSSSVAPSSWESAALAFRIATPTV